LRLSRRAILLMPLLLALAACDDGATAPRPFAPASDRPTFIFFYTQG
jgi:hypothetical protein